MLNSCCIIVRDEPLAAREGDPSPAALVPLGGRARWAVASVRRRRRVLFLAESRDVDLALGEVSGSWSRVEETVPRAGSRACACGCLARAPLRRVGLALHVELGDSRSSSTLHARRRTMPATSRSIPPAARRSLTRTESASWLTSTGWTVRSRASVRASAGKPRPPRAHGTPTVGRSPSA